jgi:hypothetical protein
MPNFIEKALQRKAAAKYEANLRARGRAWQRKMPQIRTIDSNKAMLTRRGLITLTDVAAILDMPVKMVTVFSALKATQQSKCVCAYYVYTIDQLACFAQAKIYATVENKTIGEYYVNMAMMASYLKEHWPKWEAEYEEAKYEKRPDPRSRGSRSSHYRIKNCFWTGI